MIRGFQLHIDISIYILYTTIHPKAPLNYCTLTLEYHQKSASWPYHIMM